MAVAGAGAEIMDKSGAGAENKQFRLRNTGNHCNKVTSYRKKKQIK